ncbi:MAG: hypothetical protein HZA03_12150 [Nitrospinae bacterium]|nr:hypothetical protein [Nitrospinota bacterium]
MRLLIIRDVESEALKYVDLARADQKIVLMQNAVYDAALRQKGLCLAEDVKARGIQGARTIDYSALVDEIFSAEKVLCI